MHTTVKYKGTNKEKRAHALVDCVNWLGRKKYDQGMTDFQAHLRANPTRSAIRELTMALSFAGIQGYPARQFALEAARRNGAAK